MAINIANRSQPGVIKSLRGLSSHYSGARFLPICNKYRIDVAHKLTSNPPATRTQRKQLGDYISSSSFTHLADAWSYLGRSKASSIAGDPDIATHLAYYAELRAAMSLLATFGVGIFKNRHYYVDLNGLAQDAGNGATHVACWEAFKEWATSSGWEDISSLVMPGSKSMKTFTDDFASYAAAPAIGANLLKELGLDLGILSTDQALRNEASYRPTAFRYIPSTLSRQELIDATDHLDMMVASGGFGTCLLSESLLANVLARCFESRHNLKVENKTAEFKKEVSDLNDIHPQPGGAWVERITEYGLNPNALLATALGQTGMSDPGYHSEVLARSTILCFLATISVRSLLDLAQIRRSKFDFWLSSFALERGICVNELPEDIDDLWGDVTDAIESIQPLRGIECSNTSLFQDYSSQISEICKLERVFMIGVCA